ncbi:caveolin [Saccoglossus kowalevskii]|uniref:Caveolin n=1 Tax=Saccoglossus kowalevskii TaxID=10224 RepID=D1LWY1_SACKO|nr:caveolin [Saccoglossus kowalevskii]ACY92487.1 caveolin [Saccoglossus kowalevskii]
MMADEPQMNVERSGDDIEVKIKAPSGEHLDMDDRDPTKMNEFVRVAFEEVFAEPEGMHSFDAIWRYAFITFTGVKFWCYRITTCICGIPCAVCWGIEFACLTFWHVWYVVPYTKAWLISINWLQRLWQIWISCFMDPLFDSFSRIFSNIKVTVNRD